MLGACRTLRMHSWGHGPAHGVRGGGGDGREGSSQEPLAVLSPSSSCSALQTPVHPLRPCWAPPEPLGSPRAWGSLRVETTKLGFSPARRRGHGRPVAESHPFLSRNLKGVGVP